MKQLGVHTDGSASDLQCASPSRWKRPEAKIVKSKEYVNVSDESGNEYDHPLAKKTARHQPTSAPIQPARTPSARKQLAPAMDIEPPAFTSPAQHMQTHRSQMTHVEFTDGMNDSKSFIILSAALADWVLVRQHFQNQIIGLSEWFEHELSINDGTFTRASGRLHEF